MGIQAKIHNAITRGRKFDVAIRGGKIVSSHKSAVATLKKQVMFYNLFRPVGAPLRRVCVFYRTGKVSNPTKRWRGRGTSCPANLATWAAVYVVVRGPETNRKA